MRRTHMRKHTGEPGYYETPGVPRGDDGGSSKHGNVAAITPRSNTLQYERDYTECKCTPNKGKKMETMRSIDLERQATFESQASRHSQPVKKHS